MEPAAREPRTEKMVAIGIILYLIQIPSKLVFPIWVEPETRWSAMVIQVNLGSERREEMILALL
jgi:hypothetical protein